MKGFGLGDMGGLMKQAQKMQSDLKKVQDDLKDRIVGLDGTAFGGARIENGSLVVGVNNILDKEYESVYGYPFPGTVFTAGIRLEK